MVKFRKQSNKKRKLKCFQNAKEGKSVVWYQLIFFGVDRTRTFTSNEQRKLKKLKKYMSQLRVPKTIRTDQGTVVLSETFAKFCSQFFIEQVTRPVGNHKGNGKID